METMVNTQIGKWDNGLAVRIPDGLARELKFQEGTRVELLRVTDGLLIRAQEPAFVLADLLAKVNQDNLHWESDWGPSVGREQ